MAEGCGRLSGAYNALGALHSTKERKNFNKAHRPTFKNCPVASVQIAFAACAPGWSFGQLQPLQEWAEGLMSAQWL